jgi:hypothetical protein
MTRYFSTEQQHKGIHPRYYKSEPSKNSPLTKDFSQWQSQLSSRNDYTSAGAVGIGTDNAHHNPGLDADLTPSNQLVIKGLGALVTCLLFVIVGSLLLVAWGMSRALEIYQKQVTNRNNNTAPAHETEPLAATNSEMFGSNPYSNRPSMQYGHQRPSFNTSELIIVDRSSLYDGNRRTNWSAIEPPVTVEDDSDMFVT